MHTIMYSKGGRRRRNSCLHFGNSKREEKKPKCPGFGISNIDVRVTGTSVFVSWIRLCTSFWIAVVNWSLSGARSWEAGFIIVYRFPSAGFARVFPCSS